jgi:hypothetical protein
MTDEPRREGAQAVEAVVPVIDPVQHKRVSTLYGKCLTDDEVNEIAQLQTDYPEWRCWPHELYPDHPGFFFRKLRTNQPFKRADSIAEARALIEGQTG